MPVRELEDPWTRFIGWFVDRRLIVFLVTLLILGGGVLVSPFEWSIGGLPRRPVPVDAIPDIGENQQIVFTQWEGRSPRDVEDQITYPLTTVLLGIPGVRTVRSSSAFGFSTIYIIFEDSVEFYWSRTRVLEKLASLPPRTVPDDAIPTLGPDATALGQIFWYTLEGQNSDGETVGGWDLDELRSIQDWTVRYALQSVSGVSEVASIGGFVREYQIDIDPSALRAQGVTIMQVADAVRHSNLDVGARTLEINRVEYMVRGLGLVKNMRDLESIVIVSRDHTPIRVRDVAKVSVGPSLRRGALDDAGAPAVGGVVVARFLENPLAVISAVKEKIKKIQPGLPRRTLADGTQSQVTIVPFYDRTVLIHETLETLSATLFDEILITVIVVLVMLRNLRTSFLISLMLPIGVLLSFLCMKALGVDANIMALGGIAIAIGTMVDIGIVFVENIDQHLERASVAQSRVRVVVRAAGEVAPAVLTSTLTTIVSFLPVFALSSTELRLFAPLALTKTFAMGGALVLAIMILPSAALFVLRVRPARPEILAEGYQKIFSSIFRMAHSRDWLLLGAGVLLACYSFFGGALVIVMGLYRLARPLMSKRLVVWGGLVESIVSIVAAALLLAEGLLPLGPTRGLVLNTLFVALPIALVLLSFRAFESAYPKILRTLLRHKRTFMLLPAFTVGLGAVAWLGFDRVFSFLPGSIVSCAPALALSQAFPGFGREYMPPFDEGSFLYMPTTMPHASMGEVLEILSDVDAAIAQIPEVDRVVGKLGRVDSALDPAPVSMIETVITYNAEYRTQEDGSRIRQWRDHILTPSDIWEEIIKVAKRPGLTSAPLLMPISARIVMLQSGMRAPMGIKVHGPSLDAIEKFGLALESVLLKVPVLRKDTVFADRVVGKPYLEIDIDREAIGRFGLRIVDVQRVLKLALSGMALTQIIEARERYSVRVRYMREERDSIEALKNILVPTQSGEQIPLEQLATFEYVRGPQVIRSEDTFLTSYVLFDKVASVAETEAVEKADGAIRRAIEEGRITVPDGTSFEFVGSYQNQIRSEQRFKVLIPLALAMVFILLYLQFSRTSTVAVIYSGVVVAVSGGFLFLWLYAQPWFLNFDVMGTSMRALFQVGSVNMSVAVWIGFIALVGIATDDGVMMATYLQQRFKLCPPSSIEEVRQRTLEAGARRLRPCLMTTATTILALLPVITSQGRGSDIMARLALPMVGGMAIELITLFVVPVLYCALEERRLHAPALHRT